MLVPSTAGREEIENSYRGAAERGGSGAVGNSVSLGVGCTV